MQNLIATTPELRLRSPELYWEEAIESRPWTCHEALCFFFPELRSFAHTPEARIQLRAFRHPSKNRVMAESKANANYFTFDKMELFPVALDFLFWLQNACADNKGKPVYLEVQYWVSEKGGK